MHAYTEHGGSFFPRQPYRSEGALAHLFALRSSHSTLQSFVDVTLNASIQDGRSYLVAAPFVFATFMQMDNLTSLDPLHAKTGIYRENELSLTLLLLAHDGLIPHRLVAWMPYLWVDGSTATIAGRDVYGFPKQPGFFRMPGAIGTPADFGVESEVITRFDPASRAGRKPVLQVRRTDEPGTIEPSPMARTITDFFKCIFGLPGFHAIARGVLDLLHIRPEITFVFLKQFRDAADGAAACFQSVFEARAPITRFGTGELLLGDYEVEILDHDSAPLGRDLFGATSHSTKLKPSLACRFDLDFEINRS